MHSFAASRPGTACLQPRLAVGRHAAAKPFQQQRPGRPAAAPGRPLAPGGRGRLQVVAAVKKAGVKNVVCSKTLVVKPGQEDAAAKMCQEIVQASRARPQRSRARRAEGLQGLPWLSEPVQRPPCSCSSPSLAVLQGPHVRPLHWDPGL